MEELIQEIMLKAIKINESKKTSDITICYYGMPNSLDIYIYDRDSIGKKCNYKKSIYMNLLTKEKIKEELKDIIKELEKSEEK